MVYIWEHRRFSGRLCLIFLKIEILTYNIIFRCTYYTVIWYLHTLWNDYHHMSRNYLLDPYKLIIILLTIFLMLNITSLWPIYFITGGGYSLIPFTYFLHSLPHSPLALIHLFSVLMSLFLLFCLLCVCVCVCVCVLESTCKRDHIVFVFLDLTYFTLQ